MGPGAAGSTQLWVKERDQYVTVPIQGTQAAVAPAASPDGQWIAFDQDGQIEEDACRRRGGNHPWRIRPSAGTAWLDDRTLVYSRADFALVMVPEAGGATTVVWADAGLPAEPARTVLATPLPGARGVLFSLCTVSCAQSELWVLDLKSGDAHMLVPDARQGSYLPTGHLVYVRTDGSALAAPFDLKRLELHGTAVPILDNVALLFGVFPNLAFSAAGTMVMQVATGTGGAPEYEMVWMDRTGPADQARFQLDLPSFPEQRESRLVAFPRRRGSAIGLNTNSGDDIWIKELPTGPLSRLTFDSTSEQRPRWTPDGKSVTYIVDGLGSLRQRPADGTGKERVLVETPAHTSLLEGRWSADGHWLLLRVGGKSREATQHPHDPPRRRQHAAGTARHLPGRRVGAGPLARRTVAGLRLGRDRQVRGVYPSLPQRGRRQVAGFHQRRASAALGPQWPRAVLRGRQPQHDGGAGANGGTVADGRTRQTLSPRERCAPEIRMSGTPPSVFLRDDKRFLMSRRVSEAVAETPTFVLVENWFEEVREKVKQ